MRICFTSDLHGHLPLYDQLTELVRRERPDVLVLGGDNHPDPDPQQAGCSQASFVHDDLIPRIRRWREAASGLSTVCLLGNHDVGCVRAALAQHAAAGTLAVLDAHDVWSRDGVHFLGMPLAPPSPHWAKDFERLDMPGDPLPVDGGMVWDPGHFRLAAVSARSWFAGRPTLLEELAAAPLLPEPWIFVCHAPPFDTKLDRLPQLTFPIGSRAVRRFVEERQPLCALHGHVHESPAVTHAYHDRIGRTVCVNPGQSDDALHAILFDSADVAGSLRHNLLG